MGVKICNRTGCRNIMCDRYSSTFGHICDECFAELIMAGPGTRIDDFMDRTRDTRYPIRQQYHDEECNAEFPKD